MTAVGPRFVTRFGCLADRCEDTCCRNWRIAVDEEHYRAMERVMTSPAESARFAAAIRPTGKKPFALIVLDERGYCRLLEDGLCSVHRSYGADVLGNACASYPRTASELGGVREVALELSCPEAARLCLLAEDAMDPVEVDPSTGGRGTVRQRLERTSPLALRPLDPWLEHFGIVRAAIMQLLHERDFPVASRLFFVAYLAHRLDAFYQPTAATVDAARLASELALLSRHDTLVQLHEKFASTPAGESIAATILVVILDAQLESSVPPAFRRLVEAVGGTDLMGLGAAALGAQHRARPAPPDPALFELALENYCKHHFWLDWYLKSPSLLAHLQSLLVRVAAIRWLALGHPLASSDFPRAIVEAVYSFARTIDHNEALTDHITRALAHSRMLTLAHSVSLLKF